MAAYHVEVYSEVVREMAPEIMAIINDRFADIPLERRKPYIAAAILTLAGAADGFDLRKPMPSPLPPGSVTERLIAAVGCWKTP